VLRRNDEAQAYAVREGRNYVLYPTQGAHEVRIVTTENDQESQEPDSYGLWHRRLGHIGDQKMQLLETTTIGVADLARQCRKPCETCALSKSVRTVNREAPGPATKRLERVYSDFWGPFATPTPSGARYMLTFTDDFTRKSWIYLVRARKELYGKFNEWQLEVERQSGEKLQAIRCDNAGEYQALADNLRQRNGVIVEFTTSYTPEQNGVAERLNRTLVTKIRAMLLGSGLPVELWGEAAYTACYLYNRTARLYDNQIATPEEMWSGTKPDLSHLRVFGCVAYAQLAKEQRGKLDPTSIRGIFVGYTPTSRQYRIYDPKTKTVERYSTVRFDERTSGGTLLDTDGNDQEMILLQATEEGNVHHDLPEGDTITVQARTPERQGNSGRNK
jgi:GAG-pre-integrase domain